MTADSGTRCGEDYASQGEVLPSSAPRALDDRALAGRSLESLRQAACAGPFASSLSQVTELVEWLSEDEAERMEHGELEQQLELRGRELLRRLLGDHLALRAVREQRLEQVIDGSGVARRWAEQGHERKLQSVFGEVSVERRAYRERGAENLHPADGLLNLPEEKHSHGLRRLAALEAPRGSFEDARDAIRAQTGVEIGKRQVEELAGRAAVDFEAFYERRERPVSESSEADEVLVLSCDAKGVVMRPEGLRPETKKKAEGSERKLQTRLSKGEKRNRKRMAEVTSVYEVTPEQRTPADIVPQSDEERKAVRDGPEAKNKWVAATVTDDASTAIKEMFEQALRRDPKRKRTWIALVDGNNHQIDRIKKEARRRKLKVKILVDWIHVAEYLWGAAWSFFNEGDPAAERWVKDKQRALLEGNAGIVAASIRRKATRLGLDAKQRQSADRCADYLLAKRRYLDYPTALEQGWPIATGVIEGACRHIVKDRMDITGARWGLDGAEAVLKLRALKANGDFDDYWRFHLAQERKRVHEARYATGVIPSPSSTPTAP